MTITKIFNNYQTLKPKPQTTTPKMANQQVSMVLVLILATIFWGGAAAQSSDCTNVLVSLSPCLNYISGNSSAPSAACCTQLGTVVRSQPQCLCEALNGRGSNLGININQTQAMAMPKACKMQTPSATLCNAASPSDTPGGGSRTGTSSDATSTSLTLSVLFFLVFTTCYASIFNMG